MSTLTERELAALDHLIDSSKPKFDALDNRYEQVVIPINNNSSIAQAGDNTGLKDGEGLPLPTLLALREASFKRK
jgi:hypothetical protein